MWSWIDSPRPSVGGTVRVAIDLATLCRSGAGDRNTLRKRAKARVDRLHESAPCRGASRRLEPRIGTDDPGAV